MNYLNGRNKFLNTNISIKSRKLAKKYLLDAKSKLGSKKEFYESLDRALHNYLKSITLFDNSNYSKINIQKELEKRNIDANIIKALNQLFSNCEMARYTPITNVEMESVALVVRRSLFYLLSSNWFFLLSEYYNLIICHSQQPKDSVLYQQQWIIF